jgi:hypothetical protein
VRNRALVGREKALGPAGRETLIAVYNLGAVYLKQENLVEAEVMFQRVLDGYEKILGLKHKSTLDTFYCLGLVYREQDKLVEAEIMFR